MKLNSKDLLQFVPVLVVLSFSSVGCGHGNSGPNTPLAQDLNNKTLTATPSGSGLSLTESSPGNLPANANLMVNDVACVSANGSAVSTSPVPAASMAPVSSTSTVATSSGQMITLTDITAAVLNPGVTCIIAINPPPGNAAAGINLLYTCAKGNCSASVSGTGTLSSSGVITNLTRTSGTPNGSGINCDSTGQVSEALALIPASGQTPLLGTSSSSGELVLYSPAGVSSNVCPANSQLVIQSH